MRNDWKAVPGYEHLEVTSDGRVRSIAYTRIARNRWGTDGPRFYPSREYRQIDNGDGYLRVSAVVDGVRMPHYVHRLVAFAHVPGYQPGYHVNHIDGIKSRNCAENLEWVPNEVNSRHAWRTGLARRNPRVHGPKALTAKKVRAIRAALALGISPSTLATIAGVATGSITAIANGKTWQHVQAVEYGNENVSTPASA